MKTFYSLCLLLCITQFSFSNTTFCPDPPSNDDPCTESMNPPLDLTGGGSHVGTTCCARGPQDMNPDGSAADFENVDCSAATEDAAVWYMYTPDPTDDGYIIILESGGSEPSEGPIAIEVYSGSSDQGCNGGFSQTLAYSCAEFGVQLKIGNCIASDEIIFVKVSTDDALENCGTFVITMVPESCGEMADDCLDITEEQTIYPLTNESFSLDFICISGCLDFACPETDANGGCPEFTQAPTVWYKIVADDIAAQMFTTVESNGNWDPIWSIYYGPDCNNLTVVDFGGTPPCSLGDNTPEIHQTSVLDFEPYYWMSITVDPASLPASGLDDGSFEICIATTINAMICLGELEGGACADESLVIEVTERELEDLPLEGPYAQGEEVTINVSFFYDALDSGSDWLIGMIPNFGQGWDMESFDYVANAPIGNGIMAEWYEEGGDCAPFLQEPNPILCTYTDEDGNLQLCNLLCSPCSECPQQEMEEGDPLPSGYFWVTNGGNPECANDCSPGEGWGIGSATTQIDWKFTLRTKVFDSEQECLDNKDLSISFQTFSDGSAGCWEDPTGECLLDRAMVSPPWEIFCEPILGISGADQEICDNGFTNINVATIDGSTYTIKVEVEDNPNVEGEMDHIFQGGSGTILDQLSNTSNDVQVVIYSAFVDDPAFIGNPPINNIEVTVYPELMATFSPIFVCEGECVNITPDVVGGGVPYFYTWNTGETGQNITVCPSIPTTYSVTVQSDLGCSDVGEVVVDVKLALEISLPDDIIVIADEEFDPMDPDFVVCVDVMEGTSPYSYFWSPPPGLVGVPIEEGECFAINESASFASGDSIGQYYLTTTVIDFFGCQSMDSTFVTILGDSIEEIEFKLIYDFFVDDDGDGVRDSLENSFSEGAFYLEPEEIIYYNTSIGEDTLVLEEGEFTLSYIPATTDIWELTTDSTVAIVLDSMNNCVKVEFGLKPIDLIREIELTHYLIQRCHTEQKFYMIADNVGTKTESGILWVEIDEHLMTDDIATSSSIDTFITPNRLGWVFEDFEPGEVLVKTVDVYIPGPPDVEVGWVLNHTIYAELTNNDGTTEIWDEQEFGGPIQCGYDPNDKVVEPFHEHGYTPIDQEDLVYKIRFQNTGNAPAFDIEIRDTLSEFLDISSVHYITGSHDEYLAFTRLDERVLLFRFTNIYLPDSTTDFEGSQGFLMFKVSLNDNLPEGTLIENTAHIYFDNNPSVVTNTTKNGLFNDLDNDGYFSPEDCDEENININPGAEEIPNNDVDEDCDGVALIIDNDMDGFNSDEDCDDENPDINPDAEEIPDNDIDEDCDGEDEVTIDVVEEILQSISIHPNPSNDAFRITMNFEEDMDYVIRDAVGRAVDEGRISASNKTIYLGEEPNGVYLIMFSYRNTKQSEYRKLLKI